MILHLYEVILDVAAVVRLQVYVMSHILGIKIDILPPFTLLLFWGEQHDLVIRTQLTC